MIGPGFVDLDALGDLDTEVLTFDNGPWRNLGRIWTEDALRRGPGEAYTPEEELFKYRYAFTQLIRGGITTALPITSMLYRAWAESYDEMAGVAAIADEIGIRAYLGPCYMSGLTYQRVDGSLAQHWDEGQGNGRSSRCRPLHCRLRRHRRGARIRAFLAPDRIETQAAQRPCPPPPPLQRETGVPMRLHCCQSVYEFETVLALAGGHTPLGLAGKPWPSDRAGDPAAWDLSFGRIRRSALVAIATCSGWFASGATVGALPDRPFGRDGEALASFASYRAKGVRFGMGTDTHPADMVEKHPARADAVASDGRHPTRPPPPTFTERQPLAGPMRLVAAILGGFPPAQRADITVFDLSGFSSWPGAGPDQGHGACRFGPRLPRQFLSTGREVMADFAVIGSDSAALTEAADRQILKARRHPRRPRAPGGQPARAAAG
jgi:cytosine/adenosine deaminase-related metal-dependent hydrolase